MTEFRVEFAKGIFMHVILRAYIRDSQTDATLALQENM
jgi:hypothetical protein